MMMVVLEILIVVVASAAIVAGIGGLVYMVVLTSLEERDRHLHTLDNAQARCARTQSQLPRHETLGPLPMLAGRARS
jgi:hypothetical protein